MHPGGFLHASLHGLGTALVIINFIPKNHYGVLLFFTCCLLDQIIHYHIDWIKTNIGKNVQQYSKKFWLLFGLDQTLHALTYILILFIFSTLPFRTIDMQVICSMILLWNAFAFCLYLILDF